MLPKFNLICRPAAMVLMAICVLSSCKKEQSADSPGEQQDFASVTSETNAEAETVFDDAFDNVLGVNTEVGVGGTGVFGIARPPMPGGEPINGVAGIDSSTCFNVSITQLSPPDRFPLEISVDFGSGCTGRDGRTRKGKITTIYDGPLHMPGHSSTTIFINYSVNDVQVEGTFRLSNQSTQDQKLFNFQVVGAKLTKPNGDITEWNSEKNIAQVQGQATPFLPLDDVFHITGGNNGAARKGDRFYQWSTEISEPLVKKFTCWWFVKGIVALHKSNRTVAELNYGNGECDNKATLTVAGESAEITLH